VVLLSSLVHCLQAPLSQEAFEQLLGGHVDTPVTGTVDVCGTDVSLYKLYTMVGGSMVPLPFAHLTLLPLLVTPVLRSATIAPRSLIQAARRL
jgi:hypothetical protein